MKKMFFLIVILLSFLLSSCDCVNSVDEYFCVTSKDEKICINRIESDHEHTYIRFVGVDSSKKIVRFMGHNLDRIQEFNLSDENIFTVETDSFFVKMMPTKTIELLKSEYSDDVGFYITVLSTKKKSGPSLGRMNYQKFDKSFDNYTSNNHIDIDKTKLIKVLKAIRESLNDRDFYYNDYYDALTKAINIIEK